MATFSGMLAETFEFTDNKSEIILVAIQTYCECFSKARRIE